ncbi:MAG: AAA family ATPase [Candidatus Omnitrophica bacterium]|nr:AAA family ATPase [Candidatus Omnitrophota bacterium]MBD3268915.1 AAA family ATPase [Candidatus Omnitrophota bacterium]
MKSYKLKPFKGSAVIDYPKNLNPQQLKAVYEGEGPCLVLAGAGSGKTRVLTYRLAFLLEKGIRPENILLVTFTNRAANEMRNRAETLIKTNLAGLWSGTFHHIGNKILRRQSKALGYSSNFSIIDSSDAKDLLDDCLQDLGFYKKGEIFPKKGVIYNIYSLAANSYTGEKDIIERFYPHLEEYTAEIKKVVRLYRNKKIQANIMDFADLLTNWLKLLDDKEILQYYSRMFNYILVDEYQDTNRLQFMILKKLSSVHKNIMVVGDDAQSIYSFRAADINNLLDFPRVFENTKIFKLQTNYRSTPQILSLANAVIRQNSNQFPKELRAIKKGAETGYIVQTKDVYQQAGFVSQKIIELNHEGVPLDEIAVLVRSRFQALEVEMELLKRNIPYIVRGGLRFFEQAHIKDVMSYIKIILNPKDELSFKRAVSLHRGIGRNFAYKIWDSLVNKKKTLAEIEDALPKRQKGGFRNFAEVFEVLKSGLKPASAIDVIMKFYRDYCYLSFDNPDERILDLEELGKMASSYSSIKIFLSDISSLEEFKGESIAGAKDNYGEETLVLSTIHQAKGLEWEAVFIMGLSDYAFPHPKALSSQESLEEERRLFYVAITRSKSILHITYPQTRYTHRNGLIINRPSMFIYELPSHLYEEIMVEEENQEYPLSE